MTEKHLQLKSFHAHDSSPFWGLIDSLINDPFGYLMSKPACFLCREIDCVRIRNYMIEQYIIQMITMIRIHLFRINIGDRRRCKSGQGLQCKLDFSASCYTVIVYIQEKLIVGIKTDVSGCKKTPFQL